MSRAAAAEGIDGEGAPVDNGRREAVRELSGSEAKLAGVSSWAERLWRGASMAAWAHRRSVDGDGVLGRQSGEMAKEQRD